MWSGKHVLVTGGAGFIGSQLVDRLLAAGARVSVFDNFSTGYREFVPPRDGLRVIEGDLLGEAITGAMRGVDMVFHLAANADIKDNLLEPRRCIDQNVVATQNVLEAMRAAGVRDIAFSSTGSVYGGGERGWIGDSPRILLDTARIRALGWAPTRTIEESVVDTLRWLAESPYVERT